MWWRETEPPEEEARRIAVVLGPWATARLHLLHQVQMEKRDEELRDALARRDPTTLNEQQRHWIRQMLWRYRRVLPSDARPRANPDDPIVRAMEEARV
jgi:hypothetical protein